MLMVSHTYDPICITFSKWQEYRDWEYISSCQELGTMEAGEGGGISREIFVLGGQFCVLFGVVITWSNTCDKMTELYTHCTDFNFLVWYGVWVRQDITIGGKWLKVPLCNFCNFFGIYNFKIRTRVTDYNFHWYTFFERSMHL